MKTVKLLALLLALLPKPIFCVQFEDSRFVVKEGRKNLIIFVHGLGGDTVGTWTGHYEGKDFYFPEMLGHESKFEDFDTFVFG